MINFISKDEKNQLIIGQIRRTVITVSSAVLLIYVVVMAGILGWTLFWSVKENKSNSDIDSLNTQIKFYSEAEAVARKLETRAKQVDDFLSSRGNSSDAAYLLEKENYPISRWNYSLGGIQSVTVAATSPGQLKEYADYLTGYYENIQPEKILWTQTEGWTGSFNLAGRKKI